MSKKAVLSEIIFRRLRYITFPLLGMIKHNFLYVLAYHRVAHWPGDDYPFDKGTISATPDDFENQLNFIKKRFNVLNFNIISEILSKGDRLPDNPIVITFDDGYADNYDIAFRALQKYGLTATVFVSTHFVDTGETFWFDKLSYILSRMADGPIYLDSGSRRHEFVIEPDNRQKVKKLLIRLFTRVTDGERLSMLKQLEQRSGVTFLADDLQAVRPLSWDQIRDMSENGIEIGSHTKTHPYLTTLSGEEIEDELAGSKRAIEEKTGKKVSSLSYPSGNFNQAVMDRARDCGYEFGISYDHDVRKFDIERKFDIPRIHVELDVTEHLFKANLLLPHLFVR